MAGQESQARVSDDISKGSLIFGTPHGLTNRMRILLDAASTGAPQIQFDVTGVQK